MILKLAIFFFMIIQTEYKFQKTQDKRWGIYLKDRLLATVGDQEVCQSIWLSLSSNLSSKDNKKAAIAYEKAVNRTLKAS